MCKYYKFYICVVVGIIIELYRPPHIYCPILVRFGISGLHIMLLSICEVRESRPRSSCGLCSVYRGTV